MLYRSMDNLIETQTGGGDILTASNGAGNSVAESKINLSQQVIRRNSELNQYSEIAINDQNDGYGS